MSSYCTYDPYTGYATALSTPYGTTSFNYQGGDGETRWVSVLEPNGGRQVYAYKGDCTSLWSGNAWMPSSVSSSLVPGNLPAGTMLDTSPAEFNSFHWDQNQSQNLPAEPVDLSTLISNQMNTARMRHWLYTSENTYYVPDLALSFEAAPSPDPAGSKLGEITWYDYAGKVPGLNGEKGTQIEPSLVARLLPDGSTWYQSYQRNSFGLATSETATYGTGNPAPTRTYTYTIAANGQDLAAVYLPGNYLSASYAYNSSHEVLTSTRYPDGVTPYTDTWTYNAQGQPQTLVTAGGLSRTYSYNASSGTYPGYLSGIADQPTGRTESFTWTNGNVATHTDPRGLALTNTWDGINRLTEVDYPAHDGIAASSLHYSYSLQPGYGFNTGNTALPILDLAGKEDRLNNWTYYGLDQIRRITSVTDPLSHTTSYTYCGCGSPETVTDARNNTTTYTYNNAGWKTAVAYADNTTESYGYDALGRLTTRSDALGTRTYAYYNQSLLAGITSTYGTVRSLDYDVYDNPTSDTDANGVTITKTFDLLARPLTRSIPGQNTELFQYSDLGVTNYTGPDGNVTKYAYDAAGRKTSETTPKNETTTYGYSTADDLLTLTDGRNNQTTWTYDVEGLVRTKTYPGQSFANLQYTYDANQRLATRAFYVSLYGGSTTHYTYDNAGNLTFVQHPSGTNVTFTYTPVNKIATMNTTGLGTTTFTYTPAELPASEGGLWANDAVSLTYHPSVPGLRAGLTAQQPSGAWSQTYTYDADRRLETLASPAGTFTYTYLGPGTLWTNLALPNTAAITNGYDGAARLLTTALINSSGVPINEHVYLYDTAGRRQKQTLIDGSYTAYNYDNDSQLAGSLGYTAGGSPVASQQLGFTYDAGFNMSSESVNGTPTAYTVNSLNELTAEGATAFTYDASGNRASSSAQNLTYTYDDEHRLVLVSDNVNHTFQTTFLYDGLGRLRQRFESEWVNVGGGGNGPQNGTGPAGGSSASPGVMGGNYQWMPLYSISYIYDGNRVIQERDVNNNPLVGYTRGTDLSGSLEGAGGIGGLLARSYGYSGGNWSAHGYYHADGNGNITYLVNSGQGLAASYRYDPYGNTIASSGTLAVTNVYRFSSKECHVASGMYYYLYRFYDPTAQRWPNRDPIAEQGHRVLRGACMTCYSALRSDVNSYEFCDNSPILEHDAFGLVTKQDCDDTYDNAMKAANQAGLKCLGHAVGEGLIGGVLWGLGGAVVGGVGGSLLGPEGTVPGMGLGAVGGEVANVCIDLHHLHQCQQKVNQMKQAAQQAHNDCLKQASDQ